MPAVMTDYHAIKAPVAVVLYTCYLLTGHSVKLRAQLACCRYVRHGLAKSLSLPLLQTVQEDSPESGPGWWILPMCFSVMLYLISLVHLFEGNVPFALSVFGLATGHLVLTYFFPRKVVALFGRLTMVHQVLSLWVGATILPAGVFHRATMARSMTSLLFCDTLDEVFLQMGWMTFVAAEKWGWDDARIWLPLRIFLLFHCPIHILGVREWICSQKLFGEGSRLAAIKRQFFTTVSIPFLTIFFCMGGGAEIPTSQSHLIFARAIGLLNMGVLSLCLLNGDFINDIFSDRSVATLQRKLVLGRKSSLYADERTHLILDILFAAIMLACMVLWSIPLVCLSGAILLFGRGWATRPGCSISAWRYSVLGMHLIVLMVSLLGGETSKLTVNEGVSLVILTTSRILLAFKQRPFSLIMTEVSLFNAVTAMLIKDSTLVPLLAFLMIAGMAISLLSNLSREHSSQMLKREDDCQAFLSHALKQRLSGVGSAVESLVTDVSGTKLPSSLNSLFNSVLMECHRGEIACHAQSVLRNIRQGLYKPQITAQNVRTNLESWKRNGFLLLGKLLFTSCTNNGSVSFVLDWELLRVFLCHWARGVRALLVSEHTWNDSMTALRFQLMGQPVTRDVNLCEQLGKELHGFFSGSNQEIFVALGRKTESGPSAMRDKRLQSLESSNSSDVSSSPGLTPETVTRRLVEMDDSVSLYDDRYATSSMADTTATESDTPSSTDERQGLVLNENEALPEKLRFAILDDNSLVRRNIERVVRLHLNADTTCVFSRGSNLDECMKFTHELLDRQVDVAIIDENLEFGDPDEQIKGSEVAQRARQLGYRGCIILHSAMSLSASRMKDIDQSFDGYVEKTSSKDDFIRGVMSAWRRHQCAARMAI